MVAEGQQMTTVKRMVWKWLRLVFNDDGGIWEGSWSAAEQAAFRASATVPLSDELWSPNSWQKKAKAA